MSDKKLTIAIKGKDYTISEMTIGMLADFERYIKEQNLRAFFNTCESLDKETKIECIREIAGDAFDDEKRSSHLSTLMGVRYMTWRAINNNHPEITLEGISDLIDLDNYGEILAIVMGAAETPEDATDSKNSTGVKAKKQ